MIQTAFLLLALAVQGDPAAEAVRKLGSDSIEERDSASKKLKELGESARRALQEASKDSDIEIARRAGTLLRTLDLRTSLSERIRTDLPGIEDRLATDVDHEWTLVFLSVVSHQVSREDLSILAPRALRGASNPQEKMQAIQIVANNKVTAATPEAIKLLTDADRGVAGIASACIVHLDGPELRRALVAMATGGPPPQRATACRILANVQAAETAPVIANLLTHADPNVQREALDALVAFEARGEAGKILAILKSPQPVMHERAARALRSLEARSVIPELVALLKNETLAVRLAGVRTLEMLRAKEALPDILRLLSDPDAELRSAAVWAAGGLGGAPPAAEQVALLKDEDSRVRAGILWSLGRARSKDAKDAILKGLEDPDPDVREVAAWAAGTLDLREAGPLLVVALDKPGNLTPNLVWAAGRLQAEKAIPLLLKMLKDPRARGSEEAALALARLRSVEAIPALFERPNPRARRGMPSLLPLSAAALRAYPAADVLPKSLETLSDRDPERRALGAQALRVIQAPESIPRLIKALDDPNEDVKATAALALGEMGAKEALPALLKLLENKSSIASGSAGEALAHLGATEALPTLRRLAQEQDRSREGEVVRALDRFGDAASLDFVIAGLRRADSDFILAAGMWLCREGRKVAIQPILEDGEIYFPLNGLRRPAEWKTLHAKKLDGDLEGTELEVMEGLGKLAGLSVDWEREDWEPDVVQLLRRIQIANPGGRMTALDALLVLVRHWDNDYEVILDPGRLRIVPYGDAQRFWKKWGEAALKEK